MAENGEGKSRNALKTDANHESLMNEYFRLMRTGDDAGAMRILTAVLASSPLGWWLLNPS